MVKSKSQEQPDSLTGFIDFFRNQYYNLQFKYKSITNGPIDFMKILSDDGRGRILEDPNIRIFSDNFP